MRNSTILLTCLVAASLLVKTLVIMDAPFARLSHRAKLLFGAAAIATSMVALAVWILGSFVDLSPPATQD